MAHAKGSARGGGGGGGGGGEGGEVALSNGDRFGETAVLSHPQHLSVWAQMHSPTLAIATHATGGERIDGDWLALVGAVAGCADNLVPQH